MMLFNAMAGVENEAAWQDLDERTSSTTCAGKANHCWSTSDKFNHWWVWGRPGSGIRSLLLSV